MRSYSLINDTTRDQHIGCDAVVTTIRRAARDHGWSEAAHHLVGRPIAGSDYERLLSRSALVVINGEGTLHDDSRACKNLAHFAAVAKEHGKRVALINASYSNNSAVTSQLFSACDVIAFRESHAAASFMAHVRRTDITVSADLSLLSFPPRSDRPASPRIGITDSVLKARTRELFVMGQALGASYLCIKDQPGELAANAPLKAAARAWVQGLASGHPGLGLCAQALFRRSRAGFHEQMDGIALLITGRFHGVMYCIARDIPFLYLASNTDKIDHVLTDVGLDLRKRKLGSAADLSRWSSPSEVIAASAFSAQELQALAHYRATYVGAAERLLDRVFA